MSNDDTWTEEDLREALGRKVREVWLARAREREPDTDPVNYTQTEWGRETDRRIGEALYAMGAERRTRWQRQRDGEYSAAVLEIEKLRQRLANLLGVGPEKIQGLEEVGEGEASGSPLDEYAKRSAPPTEDKPYYPFLEMAQKFKKAEGADP